LTARRLLRCSPSSLRRFDECPRAYWYEQVARPRPPRPPMSAYRAVGTSVHLALAALWDDRQASVTDILAAKWIGTAFASAERSERWLATAIRWLHRYVVLDRTVDRGRQPLGVERTVSTTTGSLALSGRVDRLDDRPEGLVVVDYKAGHRPLEPGDARRSQPLALYAIAAGRMFRRWCGRVELHHIPTGAVDAAAHDRESFARHLARAEETGLDIAAATDTLEAGADRDEVFPPRPSVLCSYCDWRGHCPEGQAYPAPDPERLLDEWEAAA